MRLIEYLRDKIVDDLPTVFRRWSVWLTSLMVAVQAIWATMPAEARQLFPGPEYVGIGLGIAALIATIVKQGKKDG